MAPRVKNKDEEEQNSGGTLGSAIAVVTMSSSARRIGNGHHRRSFFGGGGSRIHDYIPDYLRSLITPYHGDFCYTSVFHPRLITQLMVEGFLPIATEGYLLPKLHRERCVINLPNDLHVGKSIRKKSKRFSMTVDQAFDQVVEGCRQQHGRNCWLYPPLVAAFKAMHDDAGNAATVVEAAAHGSSCANTVATRCPVKLYSIEVWNEESGELVAGELGYTVNSIYTSLTGFSRQDSAGSVQLAALGRWLCQQNFTLWDLGMDMDYKRHLGAHLMARDDFVEHVHSARRISQQNNRGCQLPVSSTRMNCKAIIDDQQAPAVSPPPQQRQRHNNKSREHVNGTSPCKKKQKASS